MQKCSACTPPNIPNRTRRRHWPFLISNSTQKAQTLSSTETQTAEEDELDAAHHHALSLRRRVSIKQRLKSGHSLSSTHGNTCPYEEKEMEETKRNKAMNQAEARERRQTHRREWVHDKIEKGRALSGGHWDEK
eukprot:CCRYP_004738-RA/>CCRYP_004738-RA protein AED:0.01 eAED:0.00 QI:0/-1/0/1/-1/1/1/0/133